MAKYNFSKEFPTFGQFNIDEIIDTSITQSEMELLAIDQFAIFNTRIIIYMLNSGKYKIENTINTLRI